MNMEPVNWPQLAYYIDAISIPEGKGRERNTHKKISRNNDWKFSTLMKTTNLQIKDSEWTKTHEENDTKANCKHVT